ncbi:MAG: NTP transferase domain-containing protein [Bdellovibrionales bacterium]|nr:NTP transferase domain-containing protein [Bdellovibrionales bacterium]
MPLTKDIPKPMVRVAGRPFLEWQLTYLQRQGVQSVLLLVSHLAHVIEDYFSKNPMPGMRLRFSTEPEPLGTGGALRLALPKLDSQFWLINGDSFLPLDLQEMADHSRRFNAEATMAVLTDLSLVPVPGNIRVQENVISAYQKGAGAASGFPNVDAGIYLLHRRLIEATPEGKFDLERLWPPLIEARKLVAYPITQRFFDIGTPERLQYFEEHLDDYF